MTQEEKKAESDYWSWNIFTKQNVIRMFFGMVLLSQLNLGGIKDCQANSISLGRGKPLEDQTFVLPNTNNESYQNQWGCQPDGRYCSPVYDPYGNPIGAECRPAPQCEALFSPNNPFSPNFNPQPDYGTKPQETKSSAQSDESLAISILGPLAICCLSSLILGVGIFLSQSIRDQVFGAAQKPLDEAGRISSEIVERLSGK